MLTKGVSSTCPFVRKDCCRTCRDSTLSPETSCHLVAQAIASSTRTAAGIQEVLRSCDSFCEKRLHGGQLRRRIF